LNQKLRCARRGPGCCRRLCGELSGTVPDQASGRGHMAARGVVRAGFRVRPTSRSRGVTSRRELWRAKPKPQPCPKEHAHLVAPANRVYQNEDCGGMARTEKGWPDFGPRIRPGAQATKGRAPAIHADPGAEDPRAACRYMGAVRGSNDNPAFDFYGPAESATGNHGSSVQIGSTCSRSVVGRNPGRRLWGAC